MTPAATFQTVRLARGRHASPGQGVCTMELCSMLAEEPFTDQPAAVCPILAAFVRGYNDHLTARQRQGLFALAAELLDTRAPNGRVEAARFHRLLALARRLHATRTVRSPFGPRFRQPSQRLNAEVAGAHCALAVRRRPELHDEVVGELLALAGAYRPAPKAPVPLTALSPAVELVEA